MGRRKRADAGATRPRVAARCKSCGVWDEACSFRGFCSDDCAETGADLMPEEIELMLSLRGLLRKVGVLPRLALDETTITSHRLNKEAARMHGIQQRRYYGHGSIGAAALDYKRGQV